MRVALAVFLLMVLFGCEHSTLPKHPPTTGLNGAYIQQLNALEQADQSDRQRLFALFKQHGFQSPQADSGNRWLMRRDSVRFAQFRALLGRYGWPRRAQVGTGGMSTAFLFVQHAPDSSAHAIFYTDMATAFRNREILGEEWATYLDRYLLYHGRPQRYVTQSERRVLANGSEEQYLSAVENPVALEARRAALGLDSITPELKPGTLILKE